MRKFQRGDKVIVKYIDSKDWSERFLDNGGSFGEVYEVTGISSSGTYLLEDNKFRVNFRESWLDLAKNKEVEINKTQEIRLGVIVCKGCGKITLTGSEENLEIIKKFHKQNQYGEC